MHTADLAVDSPLQFEQFGELAATGLWSWVQGLIYWGILALGVLTPLLAGAYSLVFDMT